MAKKKLDPILELEKQLAKTEAKLDKARLAKVAKLNKSVVSKTNALNKLKSRLVAVKAKKTPAAQKQRVVLADQIVEAKKVLSSLKVEYQSAVQSVKEAALITKEKAKAEKSLLKKAKKSARNTTKKKIAKKASRAKSLADVMVSKKTQVKTPLTPDVTEPVNDKTKAPSKVWKPKPVESTMEENKTEASLHQSSSDRSKAEEVKQAERVVPEEKTLPEEKPVPDTQSEFEVPKVTNWHSIPIVKPSDS